MAATDHFREAGKHYGYPPCCINWFIDRFEGKVSFELTDDQEKAHNNKGFIPCPSCAKKVASGEVKIEELIQNRQDFFPYPGTSSTPSSFHEALKSNF